MPPGQIVRTPHEHTLTEAHAVNENPPSPIGHRERPKPHPDDRFEVLMHGKGHGGWIHVAYFRTKEEAIRHQRQLRFDRVRVKIGPIAIPPLPPPPTPPPVTPDPTIVERQNELRDLWEQLGITRAVPNDLEVLRRQIAGAKDEIERRGQGLTSRQSVAVAATTEPT